MRAETAQRAAPPMAGQVIRHSLMATPLAVREALGQLFHHPALQSFGPTTRDTAEIVLAEVLNNIVEHAYGGHGGHITVQVEVLADRLLCQIHDGGRPMPGLELPQGQLRRLRDDDLPEGGFGWHLIRSLARDLAYVRRQDLNTFSFRVDASQ